MPLLLLALLVGAGSAWLPDRGDPRRAGADDKVPDFCPVDGCGLALHPSETEYVCDAGHAFSWDAASSTLVASD